MANNTKTKLSEFEVHKGLYDVIKENIDSIPDGALIFTNDKNVPVPTQADEGKALYVDSFGRYVLRPQAPSQTFTYDTYQQFLDSVDYTQEETRAVLNGLYDEFGVYISADVIGIGADVYFRAVETPDLWLSAKVVLGQVADGSAFFTELETKGMGNGVLIVSGENLENTEYVEGQLYYCTSSSDSFEANTLYCGTSSGIIKLSSSIVSVSPEIKSFTCISGTYEIGSVITSVPYTFSLKKASEFASLQFIFGGSVIHTLTSFSTTSGSFSYTINNTSVGTKTMTLKGTFLDGNTSSKSASYYVYSRQYYSGLNVETMTTEIANENYSSVVSSTSDIKTYLQGSLPSSVTLELGDTPTYAWFIIPSNLTINTLKSGGFDFPFTQQDNISITNSLGATITYKVYRSSNQVYGSVVVNIN